MAQLKSGSTINGSLIIAGTLGANNFAASTDNIPGNYAPNYKVGKFLGTDVDGDISWLDSFSPTPSVVGTTEGYIGYKTSLAKFPFAAPFATATEIPYTLTNTISPAPALADKQAAIDSPDKGYLAGWRNGVDTTVYDTIESFPYTTPFTATTDIGNLAQGRYAAAGSSSTTEGYVMGGYDLSAPAYISQIDKFPFSSPFTTATDAGDITTTKAWGFGLSSATDGYHCTGIDGPGPSTAGSNDVDKFPFSAPFVTTTDIGSFGFSCARGGVSSPEKGYQLGRFYYSRSVGPAPAQARNSVIYSNTINSFPFSAPTFTSTTAGSLAGNPALPSTQQYPLPVPITSFPSYAAHASVGTASPEEAFVAEGSALTRISKFPFAASAPFGTATDAGDLPFTVGSQPTLENGLGWSY